VALGSDLGDPGLRETPRRVAAAFAELLSPEPVSMTTFPNDGGYDELVVVREIPFHSLCMHHLLVFHGVAHVATSAGVCGTRSTFRDARPATSESSRVASFSAEARHGGVFYPPFTSPTRPGNAGNLGFVAMGERPQPAR